MENKTAVIELDSITQCSKMMLEKPMRFLKEFLSTNEIIMTPLTTTLDVVKTRLMTQNVNKVAAVARSGVSATVKQILKEEGWVGFTRGMGPRVLHSACFSALGYFAFETARLAILNERSCNIWVMLLLD